jgi:F420-dependent oxidoreductase-like protein
VECCITTEPHQGATYAEQLGVATAAEALGFHGYFRSDHFIRAQAVGGLESGLPGPTDAWTTLAALARETSTIRLGTLVTSATFRHPGMLAVIVAQVDEMSGGRIELGLGTGWNEEEHRNYGVPFPSTRERFDRFEEQLAVISGLWRTPVGDLFSFSGEHYQLESSPALPKPLQRPGPPIIIGGAGQKRTPEIAAAWADEFNLFGSVEGCDEQFTRVRRACDAIGRDPGSLKFSVAQVILCGRNTREIARRASAVGRTVGTETVGDTVRPHGGDPQLAGTPDQIVQRLADFARIGADRVYFQILDYTDLDHLELLATEVMPYV